MAEGPPPGMRYHFIQNEVDTARGGRDSTMVVSVFASSTGKLTTRMVGNEIGVEGEGEYSDYAIQGTRIDLTGVDQHCYLDAVRRRGADGRPVYFLLFSYSGPRDLHIVNRKSLTLLIDEHTSVVLTGRGEVEREVNEVSQIYAESFYYLIEPEVLARVANADEVDIVVAGREFELKCYLLDKNFDNFQRFVKEYVDRAD